MYELTPIPSTALVPRKAGWLRSSAGRDQCQKTFRIYPYLFFAVAWAHGLREETEVRPKPMVPVGNRPILWHIMRTYSHHGFRRFILCLGYKAEVIKEYFLNYASMNSDFTVDLMTNNQTVHSIDHEDDWEVTLAYTGELAMTGARVSRAAAKYLGDARHFAVTYGDGVTDASLGEEFRFLSRARAKGHRPGG